MSNVRDIAKQAGVSIGTVSRVLNSHPSVGIEARAKVLRVINEERYAPSASKQSNSAFALVYTGECYDDSAFDSAVLSGMFAAASQVGRQVTMLDTARAKEPSETFTQLFIRKGIQGAVLRVDPTSWSAAEQIAEEGFPAVLLGCRSEHPELSYVDVNSKPASKEAVRHLIALGHTSIGMVNNTIEDSDHSDRHDGYSEALEEAGIAYDERLAFRATAGLQGGIATANRLLTLKDRPSALYVADPMTAIGVIKQAQTLGFSVPGDLSVIGFDDSNIRSMVHPTMSAVCQDARGLGIEAVRALSELAETSASGSIRKSSDAWLEVHGTTAPPNASHDS